MRPAFSFLDCHFDALNTRRIDLRSGLLMFSTEATYRAANTSINFRIEVQRARCNEKSRPAHVDQLMDHIRYMTTTRPTWRMVDASNSVIGGVLHACTWVQGDLTPTTLLAMCLA